MERVVLHNRLGALAFSLILPRTRAPEDTMTSLPALVLGATLGLAVGVGGYTFLYAKGASYLTDDPAACANCHVMTEQYDGWLQSSHRAAAVCNDCHTPHSLVPKYYVKAKNGFWHSFYFTFGGYPEPIQITNANKQVTEQTCRSCHADIVDAIDGPAGVPGVMRHAVATQTPCLSCHRSVGHLH
jgi:cytochrome c nitrite reductase small subunit